MVTSDCLGPRTSGQLLDHPSRILRRIKALLAGLICLITSACSTLGTQDLSEQHFDWQTLAPQIATHTSWQLMGKIGVRTKTESSSAAINSWVQADDYFSVQLSSTFLGLGSASITGTPALVTLEEAGEAPLYSDQPNELIEAALGFPLPISHLPYWIKGLPVPDNPYKLSLNKQGLPESMSQLGWTIQYSRYHLDGPLPLPGKIKLLQTDTQITLAIKHWTLH